MRTWGLELALLGAGILGGCRTPAASAGASGDRAATRAQRSADEGLSVSQLSVVFPQPGVGRLTLVVPDAPADTRQVLWELFLGGRRFASGVSASVGRSADGLGLSLDEPLVWHHLGWLEGARYLTVEITGELVVGAEARRVRFSGRRELLVQGSPLLETPGD